MTFKRSFPLLLAVALYFANAQGMHCAVRSSSLLNRVHHARHFTPVDSGLLAAMTVSVFFVRWSLDNFYDLYKQSVERDTEQKKRMQDHLNAQCTQMNSSLREIQRTLEKMHDVQQKSTQGGKHKKKKKVLIKKQRSLDALGNSYE